MTSCECCGMCKCIYCIPLMNTPSCKSILVSCGCMFWWVFSVSPPWATWLAIMKSPPPQLKIKYFMLFYTYIILHDRIKSYIFICLHLHCFTWSVKPYKCIYLYTYKSHVLHLHLVICTHNIGSYPWTDSLWLLDLLNWYINLVDSCPSMARFKLGLQRWFISS